MASTPEAILDAFSGITLDLEQVRPPDPHDNLISSPAGSVASNWIMSDAEWSQLVERFTQLYGAAFWSTEYDYYTTSPYPAADLPEMLPM